MCSWLNTNHSLPTYSFDNRSIIHFCHKTLRKVGIRAIIQRWNGIHKVMFGFHACICLRVYISCYYNLLTNTIHVFDVWNDWPCLCKDEKLFRSLIKETFMYVYNKSTDVSVFHPCQSLQKYTFLLLLLC